MHKHSAVRFFVFILAISFVISGCDNLSSLFGKKTSAKKTEYYVPKGKIVAKVGSMVVTLEELDRYVEAYNGQIDTLKEMYPGEDIPMQKVTTKEDKERLLREDLIRQRLLYQEALDRGLHRKDDIQTAIEEFKRNLLVASLVQEEVDKVKVTSSDVEDYYNQNKELFREPEQRKVREIIAKTKEEANAALIEVLQGTDFAAVARKYSISKSASDGGDLGYIYPGTRNPQFDIAVYSLDIGEVSSVIKNADTGEFYVVKVEEKKESAERNIYTDNQLWKNIELGLQQEKQSAVLEELVGKLWSNAKIDIQTSQIK